MINTIELTFTQCKQFIKNGYDLADLVKKMNDQPEFIRSMGLIRSVAQLHFIQKGGCAGGGYMPAVTYRTALKCMSEHHDDVFERIHNEHGYIPQPEKITDWSCLATYYVSMAVELWVGRFNLMSVNWD